MRRWSVQIVVGMLLVAITPPAIAYLSGPIGASFALFGVMVLISGVVGLVVSGNQKEAYEERHRRAQQEAEHSSYVSHLYVLYESQSLILTALTRLSTLRVEEKEALVSLAGRLEGIRRKRR